MKTKNLIILLSLLLSGFNAFCQAPPQEFFTGLGLITSNKAEAKKNLLIAIQKAPTYYGSYHFLGVIYITEHKPDSAIWSFKKCIEFNQGNINHTKELAYIR